MTEEEWLKATDPRPMLEFVEGRVSERKQRLFAVACCRRVWHLMADQRCRRAVETAEAFADGLVDSPKLRAVNQAARRAWLRLRSVLDRSTPTDPALHDATAPAYYGSIAAEVVAGSARHSYFPLHSTACAVLALEAVVGCPSDAGDRERAAQAILFRCLVGNPFRTMPTISPSLAQWNDGTVYRLAQAIYEERHFHELPILADALEEAGCSDADILGHLRGPGPHVRGCWVVDLLLGRS